MTIIESLYSIVFEASVEQQNGMNIFLKAFQFEVLFRPTNPLVVFTPPLLIIKALLLEAPNFIVDLALLFRLLAIYPYATTPRAKFLLMFIPIFVLKAVRILSIAMLVKLVGYSFATETIRYEWVAEERAWTIADKVLTAVDNG